MSLLAMPFLIINYGGEMIYILEQRLHSQQIKAEKAQKVLHDLTRALFNEAFINELLRPQKLYTADQTRDVCDKLAQSSIMKLSTDSMDKLFDLVVMGVKYQIMSIKHPRELVDVTLNHIDYIFRLGEQSVTTFEAMDKGRKAFIKFAKDLCVSEFAQIRQALLDFSIRKRVKVSLFLQEKMQHHDGRFVLSVGGPLPSDPTVRHPGTITFDDGSSETFRYPLQDYLKPKQTGDPYNPETRECTLGQNFYTIDRNKQQANATSEPPKATPTKTSEPAAGGKASRTVTAGAAELNSLGSLLGVASDKVAASGGHFRLALFDAEEAGGAGGAASGTEVITIPRMTRDDLYKINSELCDVMAGMDVGGASNNKPDDLGDLLDMAGS